MISFVLKPGAAQRMFFDTRAVIDAVGRGNARAMAQWGGFARTTARRSIRKRKTVSEPGKPPHSHTGALRDFIYFSYDPKKRSVVVGPVVLNQLAFSRASFNRTAPGQVPAALEYGGTVFVYEVQLSGGLWTRADFRSRRRIAERPQRFRAVQIAARPYMQPAGEKANERLPDFWTNSVRRAA